MTPSAVLDPDFQLKDAIREAVDLKHHEKYRGSAIHFNYTLGLGLSEEKLADLAYACEHFSVDGYEAELLFTFQTAR
jgi:hypothetical protein